MSRTIKERGRRKEIIMQKRTKIWIVVIASIALLFFGIRYVMNKVAQFSLYQTVAIEDEIVIDQQYEKIDLKSTNAKVEFVPTQAAETTVSYGGKKKSKVNFKAKIKGDTLFIQLKEKRFNFFNFSMKGLNLTVHVPEKAYREIKAEIDNGILEATNLQADVIDLKAENGLVKLKDSKGENVNVKMDNGQITLSEVNADIVARTDNGRIVMEIAELNHHVDLNADNGAIFVKLFTKPTNAKIEAKTDNGSINILGTKDRLATFGEGKYLMKLQTDNGRIVVEE